MPVGSDSRVKNVANARLRAPVQRTQAPAFYLKVSLVETARRRIAGSSLRRARQSSRLAVRAAQFFAEPRLPFRPSPSRIAVAGVHNRGSPRKARSGGRGRCCVPTAHLRLSAEPERGFGFRVVTLYGRSCESGEEI
jgi:hypothetical protein